MDQNSTQYLSIGDIKEICFSLVQELMQFEEPIPDFSTRFPQKLESIINLPQQGFGELELYPTIFEKAACYYYFTIKNHPFVNGNKRMAIVMTYVFLRMNGYSLKAPMYKMYSFAIEIAKATKDHKKEFKEVVEFIKGFSEKTTIRDAEINSA